jgi:subtilisin family serine protease
MKPFIKKVGAYSLAAMLLLPTPFSTSSAFAQTATKITPNAVKHQTFSNSQLKKKLDEKQKQTMKSLGMINANGTPRKSKIKGEKTDTSKNSKQEVSKDNSKLSTNPSQKNSTRKEKFRSRKNREKYVKDEIIVKFKSSVSASSIKTKNNLKLKKRLKTGAELLKVKPGTSVTQLAASIARTSGVVYAQPNYKLYADNVNDPMYNQLWGLNNTGQEVQYSPGTSDVDIDMPEAWSTLSGNEKPVVVAVIDTGVDINHPELKGKIWTNRNEIPDNNKDDDNNGYVDDVNGWDFYHNDNSVFDPSDFEEHGTHVSGTIAAATNNNLGIAGIAPNVKIMPLKFLGPDGGTDADAIDAIAYAKENGANLSNNSWGGGDDSPALQEAIESSGMLFVAAAGNDGVNTDETPSYPASFSSNNILSVASTDNQGYLSWFSNYGKDTVDIAAPGSDILSSVPRKAEAGAGVQVTGTNYKAIFNGFGFENMNNSQQRLDAFKKSMEFLTTDKTAPVLLIDDDGSSCTTCSNYYNDYSDVYSQLLSDAGYTNVQIDSIDDGSPGPDATELLQYQAIVWFSGDNFESVLDPSDTDNLVNYLDQGGNLLLSGQDILWTNEQSTLALDKLFINIFTEGEARDVKGVPGTIYDNTSYGINPVPFADYVSSTNPDTTTVNLEYPEEASYDNAYAYFSGTSMATPHVTGVAALELGKNPSLTADQLKAILMNTGKSLSNTYWATRSGKMINAYNALTSDPKSYDDDIPGIPFSTDQISDSLNSQTDKDDVYSIQLNAGDTINLTMSGDEGTDFDLYIYSPYASTVNTSEEMLVPSENIGTSNEKINFTAQQSGTYYIDVYAFNGSGNYTLTKALGNGPGTYEDTSAAINFWGPWSTINTTTGSIKQINSYGSASFTFLGSELQWVANKDSNSGIANVYVDGEKTEVSLYSSTPVTNQIVYKTALPYGLHDIYIDWTGKKAPEARKTGTNINIDKLIVTDKKIAPNAPTNLSQYYYKDDQGKDTLELYWDTDYYYGSFNVYRKATGETTFTKLNSEPIYSGNWFDDHSIEMGKTYEYYVTTVGYGGLESTPSDTLTYIADDDIPGIAMNNLSSSGSIDWDKGDAFDVWNTILEAGSTYVFKTNNPSSIGYHYLLFDQNTSSIFDTPTYNFIDTNGDSEGYLVFTPPTTGKYYISVSSDGGSGDYTITGQKLPLIDHLDIPTAKTISDDATITSYMSINKNYNVYAIPLAKGDKFDAVVKNLGQTSANLQLYFYRPNTQSIYGSEYLSSGDGTYTYTADADGTYYLAVHDENNSSSKYELDVDLTKAVVTPPQNTTTKTVEENDPQVTYSGTWTTSNSSSHSGGSARYNNTAGAYAQFTFNGTGIKVLAYTANNRGLADIYIDGTLSKTVDLYSSAITYQVPIFEVNNLSSGEHTIKIVNKGQKSSVSSGTIISLDALVIALPVTTQKITIEENDPQVTYNGTWTTSLNSSHSGGSAKYNNAAGAYAQFTFNGTGIKVLTYTANSRGKADIFIDGILSKTVDMYSSSTTYKVPIFEVSNLANGSHTIKIVNKGEKSSASSGIFISLDAFEVTVPVTNQKFTIEENDPQITYNGTWITSSSSNHSGGSAKYNNTAGAYAQFTFNGTGIKVLTYTANSRGKADIFIDGVLSKNVDMYSSTTTYKVPIFEISNLTNGSHTIKIVNKGEKSSASSGIYISLDAFEVTTN